MKKVYTISEIMIAQVRYYEKAYVIKDGDGQTIFTGSKEMSNRLLRILKTDAKSKTTGRKKS